MSSHPSFPSLLESFFRHRMAKQRNASPATINSYRDALRMLILFAAGRTKCKPSSLTINDLDRDAVLGFLDDLETTRGNSIQTRNARWRRSGHSFSTSQPTIPHRSESPTEFSLYR